MLDLTGRDCFVGLPYMYLDLEFVSAKKACADHRRKHMLVAIIN